jgi:putative ABC transport system ATP-binding protein
MLEAREIHLNRGDRKVLEGVSLTLEPGRTVVLTGASGCGKSTLLWALARMLPVESGTLKLDGTSDWPAPLWRTRVALVMQKHAMPLGSVKENLLLPSRFRIRQGAIPNDAHLRQALDEVGLNEVELHGDATRLSVGQTARLSLVRTLLTEPACLLLDEPFAALDPESASLVKQRLERFAGAVLVASHDKQGMENARFARMEKGTLTWK